MLLSLPKRKLAFLWYSMQEENRALKHEQIKKQKNIKNNPMFLILENQFWWFKYIFKYKQIV